MIRNAIKYVIKDTTDVLMVLAMIVVSVLDFTTDLELTGALAFFTVFASFTIWRIGYWKWRYDSK